MKWEDYKTALRNQKGYIDKTYWIIYASLVVVAVIALFSASSTLVKDDNVLGPVTEQFLYLLLGAVLAFGVQFIPSRGIRALGYLGLLASIVLLLLTFTGYGVEINGAKRWVRIAGVVFQPSEFVKLNLVIVVSDLLSRIQTPQDQKKYFFIVLGLTGVLCATIMVTNMSTAVLIGIVVFIMFFLARVSFKYWGTALAVAAAILVAGYFVVEYQYIQKGRTLSKPFDRMITQAGRVDDLIAEWKAPSDAFQLTDDNYQRTIAKVAVARGGKTPMGVFPGNSQERNFLPQAFADYIFAIILEESGLVGAIVLIVLYLAILFRACNISSRYADYSAMLMVMGLALMITCQALISMMVAVGIGPVTGQPLPLISRGGTSALVTSLYFGIIMSVAREQNELHALGQATADYSRQDVPDIRLD